MRVDRPVAAGMTSSAEADCWMLLYPRLAAFCREVQRRSSLSMTEVAVLLALHATGTAEVRALRRNLSAGAGHLSRILAAFEEEGMVTRATSAADGRQRRVTLTAMGAERCAGLGLIVSDTAREVLMLPDGTAGSGLAMLLKRSFH